MGKWVTGFSCSLRGAKAFVSREAGFRVTALAGTKGWNGATAFDEGRLELEHRSGV